MTTHKGKSPIKFPRRFISPTRNSFLFLPSQMPNIDRVRPAPFGELGVGLLDGLALALASLTALLRPREVEDRDEDERVAIWEAQLLANRCYGSESTRGCKLRVRRVCGCAMS
jgi:hypothetical protein